MKLLRQILREAGADTDSSFTVVPSFGGYFKRVKRVEEYGADKIVISIAKRRLIISGERLYVEKYFQQDLFIKGDITGVHFE